MHFTDSYLPYQLQAQRRYKTNLKYQSFDR